MNPKKSIADLSDAELSGKRVLLRADFNVPLNADGTVASDHRIRETLPTIQYLLSRHAKVIIATHLGRPKGAVDEKYRLNPVVDSLRELLPGVTVTYVHQCVGPDVEQAVSAMASGSILMLENIRFEPGEEANDPGFAKALASLADVYVNDAFGTAHRAHASTEGVAHFVPVKVAGLLMKRELASLALILGHPERPFAAIVGGSKVSTKIGVLNQLLNKVDNLVIGGGMVFTFLKARGYAVGKSLVEDDFVETARQLMVDAQAKDKVIVLPQDVVVAEAFAADAPHKTVPVSAIPEGWMGLDLGPESVKHICDVLQNTKTVFWNGPLGVFEFDAFAEATRITAEAIADRTHQGLLTSVLGGGDTQAAIDKFGIAKERYTHVSTGGGATLEMMEGRELPGVVVLEDLVPVAGGVTAAS